VTKSENGAILGRKNRQIKNAALVTFNLNFKKKKTFFKRFEQKCRNRETPFTLCDQKQAPKTKRPFFLLCCQLTFVNTCQVKQNNFG